MTDKLHCPFCHKELFEDVINSNYVACRNYHCKFSGGVVHKDILQSIIDGKKAQDALLFISNIRGAGMSYQDMFLDAQAVAKYVLGITSDLVLVGRYTQDELDGITKQDK